MMKSLPAAANITVQLEGKCKARRMARCRKGVLELDDHKEELYCGGGVQLVP